jgi:hypothetical protein
MQIRLPRVVVVLLSVALIGIMLFLVNLVRNFGDESEHALQAVNLTCCLVESYVSQKDVWPTSWRQLESVSCPAHNPLYKWPRDSSDIQQKVAIDFSLSLDDVAKLDIDDVSDFTAIRPKVPAFLGYRENLRSLLAVVRSKLENRKVRGGRLSPNQIRIDR